MSGHVLFVCTGNICRSPMAEAFARRHGVPAGSAGTWAVDGASAAGPTLAVMDEVGIDVGGHRARPLEEALLDGPSLVVAMTADHVAAVGDLAPEVPVMLLDPGGGDVPDPYGRPPTVYRDVRDHIERLVEERLDEFRSATS